MCISDILDWTLKWWYPANTGYEQPYESSSSAPTISWTIKESFINHTWSYTLVRTAAHNLLDNQRNFHQSHMVIYPCENSSSQSVGQSKKASSITHGHIPLWEQQLTICWTIKESFINHTWSYIPLWEQQLTICWTIKESFINHTWSYTLVRIAAHKLLDHQRKFHLLITHDTHDRSVHKQLLVRSSSAL